MSVPVHPVAGQDSPTWRKTPVAVVASPAAGAAAKGPACAVAVSPGRVAVPTSVQWVPSAESYPAVPLRRGRRGAMRGHGAGRHDAASARYSTLWPVSSR